MRGLTLAGTLFLIFAIAACSRGDQPAESAPPVAAPPTPPVTSSVTADMLVGDWYNTAPETNNAFVLLALYPGGAAEVRGLDGVPRPGRYELNSSGILSLQLTPSGTAPAADMMNSEPITPNGTLVFAPASGRLVLSRDPALRENIARAARNFIEARQEAQRVETKKQQAQQLEQHRSANVKRVRSIGSVRTVFANFTGGGARSCGTVIMSRIRRMGWQSSQEKSQADAILNINLSNITTDNNFFVGPYYRLNYSVKVNRFGDGKVLAAFAGRERAAGDGQYEVCVDTARKIANEMEDAVDDARG